MQKPGLYHMYAVRTNECDYFVHLKSSSQTKSFISPQTHTQGTARHGRLYCLALFVVCSIYGDFMFFHLMQDHYCDSPINNSAKIPPKTMQSTHTHTERDHRAWPYCRKLGNAKIEKKKKERKLLCVRCVLCVFLFVSI